LGLWWWKQQVPLWLHLRSAHRVITDSDWVMSILCDEYTLPRAKAYLVHPGIDVDAFRFESEARGRFRAALGLPDDALVFGSVSRLARVKGLERSVKALSALQRAGCGSAWLVLAGIGPERGALEQLAIELGVRERVVFPGRVDHASDLLAALDVFLMPSREEGFGIALIEAMACERVCVAMNSGGPADILTDPSLGWLTPPDDEERFAAAAVEAAALGAHDRAAMGRRARAHVAARFNFRAQMRDIARLISA
jgi:glycosyltransferase involved in cell wall biosynthesis